MALRAALLVSVVIGASAIGVVVAGGGAPQAEECSAQVIAVEVAARDVASGWPGVLDGAEDVSSNVDRQFAEARDGCVVGDASGASSVGEADPQPAAETKTETEIDR
ncbi:MAG: hypothetical protein O6913_03905 [Chloroflexi bacterium]|nr:hypothetical protein [Chloroflexota bacterium]